MATTSTTTTNARGIKYDEGKLRYDLIPTYPLATLAAVYTKGAEKYEANNWRKGLEWNRVFAALQRHAWAYWSGEGKDEETGLHHLAHAAWCCLTLIEYARMGTGLDNRHDIPHP